MNKILLALVVGFSPLAFGHELDEDGVKMTPAQIEAAKVLPPTLVVRTSLKDPSKVEVLQVGKILPADKSLAAKLEKAPFVAMNIDSQLTGQVASNEKDAVSSTSAWGFGWRGGWGGGGARWGGGAVRWGGGAAIGWGGGGLRWGGYRPNYSWGGFNYAYNPYYSYNSGGYSYAYCNNPITTFAFSSCGSGWSNGCCGNGWSSGCGCGNGWSSGCGGVGITPYYGNAGYWTY